MGHNDGAQKASADADVCDRVPLTPIQVGLLVEGTLSGRPWVNLEQVVCRFEDEAIDTALLQQAWHHVQRRHQMLRAAVSWAGEGTDDPQLVVHAHAPLTLQVEDWSAAELGEGEREDALARWLEADRNQGVDVEAAPAMRVTLLALEPDRSIMVWTFHHSMLDGRAFTLVLEELLEIYAELQDLGEPTERRAPTPFRAHAEVVLGQDPEAARTFFAGLLAGVTQHTPLPGVDAALPDDEGGRHSEYEVRLPRGLTTDLEARARQADATLGSALLAAWALLLSRYTGHLDVVFGCTRSGRHTLPDADQIVGCLINTVPMRARTGPDRSIDALLRDVRRQQVDVRPHEHASLVDVQRWADLPASTPLVTTNVVFERYLLGSHLQTLGGPWKQRRVTVHEEAGFGLGLVAYRDDGLVLRLEYDSDRYQAETIERMAGHLARLLDAIADAPQGALLTSLSMLSAAEQDRLVNGLNPPPVDRKVQPVLEGFADQVARRPRDIAVTTAGTGGADALRFEDLDRQSSLLAAHLVARGVGRGVAVAVCVPRSPAFLTAIFGVLKAGGAFLPLDPTYPGDALAHMLADSQTPLVITTAALATVLPVADRTVVLVDEPLDPTADGSTDSSAPPLPVPPPDLDDPAYLIYTSGSTGKPKGVVVSHRALAHFCMAIADHYELTSQDRALQFASLSFDVSIEEFLPTLLRGAAVVLRTDEMAESLPALLETVERERLTVLNLPTAFWHTLVDHLTDEAAHGAPSEALLPASVRLVITGGEKASRDAYDAWVGLLPGVRWLNGYGPTETTVTCTVHDPSTRPPLGAGVELPIGRPLTNARAYVLGADGSLAAEGTVGELWIGGASVAQGYLGRPELTEERFRPDPYVEAADARMYRTGDLARWSPAGDLEFFGRADRQIKLRGFRIEPGEVEAALESHRAVRSAFVALRPSPGGGEQLVGWVLPHPDIAPPNLDEVRALVQRSLPSHMVPTALVEVHDLPYTAGGKVDLDALPDPAPISRVPAPAGSTAAPATTRLVNSVRADFAVALGSTVPVGPDDSFFDLGGHSLLAVRLLTRIERLHGIRLSLATLHASPTPRGLAAALDRRAVEAPSGSVAQPTAEPAYLIPIQPLGTKPPLFGVHVLGTNASYYRPLARRLGTDQPVFGLAIEEPREDTPSATEEVAALYRAEIERTHPTGPLALAAVSMGGYVAFELAQQLTRSGREVSVVALFDAAGPGGRPGVAKSQRARIHARQLRSVGPRYLVERFRHVAGVTRERLDDLRLRVLRARGADTPEALWMHQFVLANVRAADAYQAQPYPGRLVAYRATGELFDAPGSVENGLGWGIVAAGPLAVVDVPGTHMTMLQEPHVAALADAVATALAEPTGPPA